MKEVTSVNKMASILGLIITFLVGGGLMYFVFVLGPEMRNQEFLKFYEYGGSFEIVGIDYQHLRTTLKSQDESFSFQFRGREQVFKIKEGDMVIKQKGQSFFNVKQKDGDTFKVNIIVPH